MARMQLKRTRSFSLFSDLRHAVDQADDRGEEILLSTNDMIRLADQSSEAGYRSLRLYIQRLQSHASFSSPKTAILRRMDDTRE